MAGSEAPVRRRVTKEAHLAIFDEAADILTAEFGRPLRIDDVAGRVATSPRQLQRVFADVAGLGFRSYLRRVRMARAADLLATTDIPVKEVARRVGYGDASQFSKAFKRTHGVSPTHSRRRSETHGGQVDALPPAPNSYPAARTGTGFRTRGGVPRWEPF